MATVYDDVPQPTAAWGSASGGSPSGGSARGDSPRRGSGPRVEDAPPVNDRRPRPTLRASAARVAGTVKTVAPPVARGAVQLGTLAAQVIATGATLAVIGSALLLAGGYADDGVGSLLLCLLAAVFSAILTTAFVVLIGLPLRVARGARLWCGVEGAPNWWLLVPGWLLFGFSLAHTWWPDRWRPERFRTKRPEPRIRAAFPRSHARGDRRRAARSAYEEFLAASGRAFRGERD
jgi:hypothetical protein